MQSILVTGGSGFIGTHMAVELLELVNEVVIYDNLSHRADTRYLWKHPKTRYTVNIYRGRHKR